MGDVRAKLSPAILDEIRRGQTDNGAQGGRRVDAQILSNVVPARTRWAWQDRIPLGSVTILAGRQGLGKSTLLANITALLTRGRLPGDLEGLKTTVLIASYEDAVNSTLVPRLMAAEADLDCVATLHLRGEDGQPGLLSLPADLDLITERVREYDAKVLIVDPLMAALSGRMDSHRDHDVRRNLAPLAQLAEEQDLAPVTVMHLRKSATNEALDRISGSLAFTAAARSVLAFGRPEDEDEGSSRVLAHAKSNLGPLASSLAYRVEQFIVPCRELEIRTAGLVYEGECEVRASELLSSSPAESRTEVEIAEEWLADELADGKWHKSRAVKASARDSEINERTLKRAKQRLDIEDRREGFPATSEWRLLVGPERSGQGDWPDHENGSTEPNGDDSTPQSGQGALSGPTTAPGDFDPVAEQERIARKFGVI